MLSVVGQSNSSGRRQIDSTGAGAGQTGDPIKCEFGAPMSDPVQPFGDSVTPSIGYYGSIWPNIVERFGRERSIWCEVKNTAVGGTSIAQDWCGYDIATGLILQAQGDADYDANGHIQNVIDYSSVGNNFDERWVIFMMGIADAAIPTSQADFANAHINIADHLLANGFKVAFGLSGVHPEQANYGWFDSTAVPAIQDVMSNYSGNSNVAAGFSVHENLTVTINANNHWTSDIYDAASDGWFEALSTVI